MAEEKVPEVHIDNLPDIPDDHFSYDHHVEIKNLINYMNRMRKKYIKDIDVINRLRDRSDAYNDRFTKLKKKAHGNAAEGVKTAEEAKLDVLDSALQAYDANCHSYSDLLFTDGNHKAGINTILTAISSMNAAYHRNDNTTFTNIKTAYTDIKNAKIGETPTWNGVVIDAAKLFEKIKKNIQDVDHLLNKAIIEIKRGGYFGGFYSPNLLGLCPYINILVVLIIILIAIIIYMTIMIFQENP